MFSDPKNKNKKNFFVCPLKQKHNYKYNDKLDALKDPSCNCVIVLFFHDSNYKSQKSFETLKYRLSSMSSSNESGYLSNNLNIVICYIN